MRIGRTTWRSWLLHGFLFMSLSGLVQAQDQRGLLQFGRLTGDLGFRTENRDGTNRSGEKESSTSAKYNQQELNLRQTLAIYDPRFIEFHLGGGLLLGQGNTDGAQSDFTLTSYDVLADILKGHPYGGNLFLSQKDADFEQSPAVIVHTKTKDRGAGLRLQEEALGLPIPLFFRFAKSERNTDNLFGGAERFSYLDYTSETAQVASKKRWGKLDVSWKYKENAIAQSQTYPEERVAIDYEKTNFSSRIGGRAGRRDAFRWFLRYRKQTQSDWPKLEFKDSYAEGRYRLVENQYNSLNSSLGFGQSESVQYRNSPDDAIVEPQQKTTDRENASLEHTLFRSVSSSASVNRETTNYPDIERIVTGRQIGTSYTKDISDGRVYWNYTVLLREEIQNGLFTQFVQEELHELVDFTPVALPFENVELSSVLVTDQSGQITYVEDLDYQIYQLGPAAYIERLPGTAILNGETVLVSYAFVTQIGVVEERTDQYTIGTRWWFMEPYISVTKTKRELVSGQASLTLYDGQSTTYGLILSEEFLRAIKPVYKIEKEVNRFSIYPFDRLSRNASVTYRPTLAITTRISVDRATVDFLEPDQSDSETYRNGVDGSFKRGRYNAKLGVSESTSLVGGTERIISVGRAGFTVAYGQWVLDTTYHTARERLNFKDGNGNDLERDYFATGVGLKRRF